MKPNHMREDSAFSRDVQADGCATWTKVMAGWRRAIDLAMGKEAAALEAICRSRSEPASRVERARILPAYRKNPFVFCSGARRGEGTQSRPWSQR